MSFGKLGDSSHSKVNLKLIYGSGNPYLLRKKPPQHKCSNHNREDTGERSTHTVD